MGLYTFAKLKGRQYVLLSNSPNFKVAKLKGFTVFVYFERSIRTTNIKVLQYYEAFVMEIFFILCFNLDEKIQIIIRTSTVKEQASSTRLFEVKML